MAIQETSFQRDGDGKLASNTFPGLYPLLYITADGGSLCPDCANGENGSEAYLHLEGPADGIEMEQWRIDVAAVNYEDATMCCSHCSGKIPAAYVDDEADADDRVQREHDNPYETTGQ